MNVELYHGDCLIESDKIKNDSVDLILTDLPYGTIKGIGKGIEKYNKDNHCEWDNIIEPKKIFTIANRILRQNGRLLLFGQQPFTTLLINSACMGIEYNYPLYWLKNTYGNSLLINKAPLNYIEDISVFTKTYDMQFLHPLREYSKQLFYYIGKTKKEIEKTLGHSKSDHFFRFNTIQFELCTEEKYQELIKVFNIDKMEGYKTYEECKNIHLNHINKLPKPTFNLWENKGHKPNIFQYAKDSEQYHPTQKPIALLEDLIKTYSNAGDTVCDLTMGSGSTGVACKNTGRHFIGIEQDKKYFEIAKARINDVIIRKVGGNIEITDKKINKISIEDFL